MNQNQNTTSTRPSDTESTSKRVATIAARGLKNPETLTLDEIQAVCASALTQVEDIDE